MMDNQSENTAYSKIVARYAGRFPRNWPFQVAVYVMVDTLENSEIIDLTGESATQVSRSKRHKGTLRIDSLQKLYLLYKEASTLPINIEGIEFDLAEEDSIPLYNRRMVQDRIAEKKDLRKELQLLLDRDLRADERLLRRLRDEAPTDNRTPDKVLTDTVRQWHKGDDQDDSTDSEVNQVETDDGNLLTEDGQHFYIEPNYPNPETDMRTIAGYNEHDQQEQWEQLSLRQRFLVEFLNLVDMMPMSEKMGELRDRMVGDPAAFAQLRKQFGQADSTYLRRKYADSIEASLSMRNDAPKLNTVKDVEAFENRLDKYLKTHPEYQIDRSEQAITNQLAEANGNN